MIHFYTPLLMGQHITPQRIYQQLHCNNMLSVSCLVGTVSWGMWNCEMRNGCIAVGHGNATYGWWSDRKRLSNRKSLPCIPRHLMYSQGVYGRPSLFFEERSVSFFSDLLPPFSLPSPYAVYPQAFLGGLPQKFPFSVESPAVPLTLRLCITWLPSRDTKFWPKGCCQTFWVVHLGSRKNWRAVQILLISVLCVSTLNLPT